MGNEDIELVKTIKPEKKRSLREKYGIAIENLSFEYITDCHKPKEIERMILILRSGEEGHFPALQKHAEARLKVLKPESQVLRVPQQILTPGMLPKEQRENLAEDMTRWMQQMQLREKDLEDGRALDLASLPHPEVRKRSVGRHSTLTTNSPKSSKPQPGRINSCDYASWDKYDADTEITRIDLQSEQELVQAKQFQKKMRDKKLAEKEAINTLALTGTEITVLAENEREKGNEAFRAGDYEEALQLYSLSLTIDSTINAYNNRAITYIKLKRFKDAVQDCDRVLSMDYTNIKALLRRATAHESLGNTNEALEDYSSALRLEPNNKSAISGVKKLSFSRETKKVRMKIEEVDESQTESQKSEMVQMTESQSKRILIEEMPLKEADRVGAKSSREVNGLDRTWKNERRNEICFCDRAPSSSSYSQPLPHRRGEYCLDLDRSEIKKSIFTCSNTASVRCDSLTSRPGVVIEEIPSEPCNSSNPKAGMTSLNNVASDFKPNVDSPYEFLRTWQSLEQDTDLKLHAQVLRTMGSSNLEGIVGSKLDGKMFSTILRCLELHFCKRGDEDFVEKFLKGLVGLRTFSIVSMFMDSRDKKALRRILEFLERENVSDTESLRKDYGITS